MNEVPSNLEAERGLIGALLVEGKTLLHAVSEIAKPGDCMDAKHEAIFAAMLVLDEENLRIDLITVAEQLKRDRKMALLAGVEQESYLAELANYPAMLPGSVLDYARFVRRSADQRRLMLLGSKLVEAARDPGADIGTVIEQHSAGLLEINTHGGPDPVEHIDRILHRAVKRIEHRFNHKAAVTGIPSGYDELDEITHGAQPGDLILIAGRPSMGKTAFVMEMAINAAEQKPHAYPALVFSLEMSKEALIERVISSRSDIPGERLRTGFLESGDFVKMTKRNVAGIPVDIDDTPRISLGQIRARAHRWRNNRQRFPDGKGMGLIVVDYLQLVRGPTRRDGNREREIAEISSGLKALGKELGVTVLALAQLSRDCEKREDKRPMCSDLRESGSLEQDADVIMFVYRDEVYDKETEDKGIAEIIIGKHRNGRTGVVKLRFGKETTSFRPLPKTKWIPRDDREPLPRTWHDEDRP